MTDALQLLLSLDEDAIRATSELRWEPATAILTMLSAWWVKGPLLVAAGWCADLRCRRVFPLVALAATVSFIVASGLNWLIKDLVGRDRPPHSMDLDALVALPASPSFPSGHAMSAFAVAAAIAVLAPRTRWAVLGVAAAIAFSRVYLGVHFWIDVLAGAALGIAVGVGVAVLARRAVLRRSPARARQVPAPSELPARAPGAATALRAAGPRSQGRPASR